MSVTRLVNQPLIGAKLLRDVQPENIQLMLVTLLVTQPLIGAKLLRDLQP